jgi:hypothetical protein
MTTIINHDSYPSNTSLEFADFVSDVCNVPQEDNRPKYRAIVISWTCISLVAVILLIISKIFIATSWGLDDTFSILTFVCHPFGTTSVCSSN